jgi:UDP-N-acetylglucosamine 2-epimerase (non-hydrolysing)
MSDVFFQELGLPEPDHHLGVGSGTQAEQTAGVMVAFEQILLKERPDLVVVVGDVTPTVACSLDAAKLCVPVAHVEAGLRSGDRRMPEEINRIVTDALSTFFFTPSPDGDANLLREGVALERIFCVGNVMIDSLRRLEPLADRSDVLERLGLEENGYAFMTMHRPSNVDDRSVLKGILGALEEIQKELAVVLPLHPRTGGRIAEFGLEGMVNRMENLKMTEPVGYLDSLKLQKAARLVLTDSGGIQEETTVLGAPCLTLRENTERPVTVEVGTNTLVGMDPVAILETARQVLDGKYKQGRIPDLWDGRTSDRIVSVLGQQV